MDFFNDLDYWLERQPNMFWGGGKKSQGKKRQSQRQSQQQPAATRTYDYNRNTKSQFIQEFVYDAPQKIREAAEKVEQSRKPVSVNVKPSKRKRGQNYVEKAPDEVSDYTKAATEALMQQYVQPIIDATPKMTRAQIKARQQQLKDMGLYTGKIDGKWGDLSKAAENEAKAKGLSWNGSSYQVDRSSFKPGFGDELNRVWNAFSAISPAARFFFDQPYRGSEEDARRLGYKTFIDENGYEHDVDYGSATMGNLSTRDRAARQMEMYGITDEMAGNKSGLDRLLYENLPSYSYDVMQTLSNIISGTKQADSNTGRSVILPEREGTTNEAERNATPFRESLRNLAFHYPDPNRRLKVSPYESPGRGEFRLGYAFYDPEVQNYILNDPIYQQTQPGGGSVQAGIVTDYYDPIAATRFAVKQMKGETKTDEKGREFYMNDNGQRVFKSGPAISTVQNTGESGPLGDYGYGAWSASRDAQGRRVAYDDWDLQLGPIKIPGFELYYKGR